MYSRLFRGKAEYVRGRGERRVSVGCKKKTRYLKKNSAETPSDSVKSVCVHILPPNE